MNILWCGIELSMTDAVSQMFPFHIPFDEFPVNCCGAGKGLGEWVVPDCVWVKPFAPFAVDRRIKISPACAVHDLGWELAVPTWDAFHEENSLLFANIKSIIVAKTEEGSDERKYANRYPALYAHAVDTAGRKIFWNMKREQGYDIPRSAAWLLS